MSLLAPTVASLVEQALGACHESGYPVAVFEGWRSPERQAQLLDQNTKDKFVTSSPPGFSFHQFGLAVDIAYYIDGKWSWEGDFDKPHAIFQSFGFDKPISKSDMGHQQISRGLKMTEIRSIAQKSTLQGLWLAMDLV